MKDDENYTRFFCFLSLFAGAMLGVVISNSILLLFMCWEIRRTYFLLVDWILVSETFCSGGCEESISYYTHRRCFLSAGNCLALQSNRNAAFL